MGAFSVQGAPCRAQNLLQVRYPAPVLWAGAWLHGKRLFGYIERVSAPCSQTCPEINPPFRILHHQAHRGSKMRCHRRHRRRAQRTEKSCQHTEEILFSTSSILRRLGMLFRALVIPLYKKLKNTQFFSVHSCTKFKLCSCYLFLALHDEGRWGLLICYLFSQALFQ